MISLVRNISLRKKVKKSEVSSAPPPRNVKSFTSKKGKPAKNQVHKNGGCLPKDWEKILTTTIEAPLALVVKTVSAEVLHPLSRALSEAWKLDAEQLFSPLEAAYIDPREVLATIDIKDITESVTVTCMALVKKLADEVVVPFLESLRVVLKTLLGDRFRAVVAWLENVVRAVVPVFLDALFGNRKESKTVQWVNTLTEDLLAALSGSAEEEEEEEKHPEVQKPESMSPLRPRKKQFFTTNNKLDVALEDSLEGSLKETLLNFKEQVEQALS